MSSDAFDGDEPGHGDRTLAEETSAETSSTLSVLGHFYRGEVERMVGWRQRLDQTTNWSVVLMAAILTFVFSSENNPHYVLLIGALAVGAFLLIEAHRYREYDVWRYRVRLLQRYFIADVTNPDPEFSADWRTRLGADLRDPKMTISRLRAVSHRLQRVYLFLITVLLAAWALRISVFDPDNTWLQTASIADIPGVVVIAVVAAVYILLCLIALWSAFEARSREFEEEPVAGLEK